MAACTTCSPSLQRFPTAMRRQTGFTLVEIAIVLVIIGLILGGVLKGQELVTSARVRNIADQQNAIKAAFFAFQDRYHAAPGDYAQANQNIPGLSPTISAQNGNGDGFINYDPTGAATSGVEATEGTLAFIHLTAAGFISCSQCIANATTPGIPSSTNSPVNAYNGIVTISYDSLYGDPNAATPPNPANSLKTGNNIPSNILAEVDSKLDDGNPFTGVFQFSKYTIAGGTPPVGSTAGGTTGSCVVTTTGGNPTINWNRQTPVNNCGAAYNF